MKPHPQNKKWLHSRSNTPRAAAPGIDPDLAEAIADTAGIQPVSAKAGAPPAKKVAAKKAAAAPAVGKPPKAGEQKEEDEGEPETLAGVFKKAMGASGDELEDDQQHDEGEHQDDEPDDIEKELNKKFAPIDDNATGTNLGRKVGEFSKQNKAMRKELAAELKSKKELTEKVAELEKRPAKAEKIEETEAYKELLERAEKAEALVDEVSLERSPRFKEKFDSQIQALAKKTRPIILSVKDKEKQAQLVDGLDRLLKIDAGEEGDERFFSGMTELLTELELPAYISTKVSTVMDQLREKGNERDAALKDWKKTKGDFTKLDLQGRQQAKQAVKTMYATVRAGFETMQSKALEALRKNEELFDYDNRHKAEFEHVMPLLEQAAETGQMSEELIRYVHNGMEAPIIAVQLQMAARQLVTVSNELAALKKKYNVVDDPSRKPKPGKTTPSSEPAGDGQPTDKEIAEHGGIVATYRRMQGS